MSRPLFTPIGEPEQVGEFYLVPHAGYSYQVILSWSRMHHRIESWDIVPVYDGTQWDADTFGYEHVGASLYWAAYELYKDNWHWLIYCVPVFDTYFNAMLYLRKHLIYETKLNSGGGLQSQWYRWVE